MRSKLGQRIVAWAAVGLASVCGMAAWSGAVEPRRGPMGPRVQEEPMSAKGVVREYVRNPHGDVDGLLLNDGTEVKIPPHQGQALRELIKAGAAVSIEGRRHVTREGDVHLHADRIVDAAADRTWEREEPADRRAPPHGVAPAAGPLNVEILHELRAIRRLLEDRK